jgi:hypothetical protein
MLSGSRVLLLLQETLHSPSSAQLAMVGCSPYGHLPRTPLVFKGYTSTERIAPIPELMSSSRHRKRSCFDGGMVIACRRCCRSCLAMTTVILAIVLIHVVTLTADAAVDL